MRRANAVSVLVGLGLAVAGLSSIVTLRGIAGDPARLEQARRTETNMEEDRERRQRLLEGSDPATAPDHGVPHPADLPPAVRGEEGPTTIRPAATAHTR